MEYTKLFGEVVVYLIFSSENAKFLFLLICKGLFIFSYEDPSSLIPQSKVCSMLISLVYINLGHLKNSQTIHLKKQFEKHENFDCFSFAICCSSSYSNYYCKFLFNFFYLFQIVHPTTQVLSKRDNIKIFLKQKTKYQQFLSYLDL